MQSAPTDKLLKPPRSGGISKENSGFRSAERGPTRRSRNQKLRREIRISKLEIRNNIKAESSKSSSLDAGGLNFSRRSDFRFVSRFEFRISDLSNLAHFARDITDK
jgi:hypothetical protein